MATSMKGAENSQTTNARSRYAFGQVDRETDSKSGLKIADSETASPLPYSAAVEAHGDVAPLPKQRKGNLIKKITMREGGGIKTIALGISDEFVQRGRIDLRGQKIRTPDDFARLATIYRSPQFETLRIFLTKGDNIVSHWGVTSRAVDTVIIYDDEWKFAPEVIDRMKRTGADGYWLSHNHPSGDSTASRADVSVTKKIATDIPGFRGHVVINGTSYDLIKANGSVEKFSYKGSYRNNLHFNATVSSSLIGIDVACSANLCEIARHLRDDEDQVSLIFVSPTRMVRAVQEVPRKFFENTDEIVGYVKKRLVEFGSSRICSYTTHLGNDDAIMRTVEMLWAKEFLMDHKFSKSGSTSHSEMGTTQFAIDSDIKHSKGFKKRKLPIQVKEATQNIHYGRNKSLVVDEYDIGA